MVFSYPKGRLNPLLFATAGVAPPSTVSIGQFLWWRRDGTAPLSTAECQKTGVLVQVTGKPHLEHGLWWIPAVATTPARALPHHPEPEAKELYRVKTAELAGHLPLTSLTSAEPFISSRQQLPLLGDPARRNLASISLHRSALLSELAAASPLQTALGTNWRSYSLEDLRAAEAQAERSVAWSGSVELGPGDAIELMQEDSPHWTSPSGASAIVLGFAPFPDERSLAAHVRPLHVHVPGCHPSQDAFAITSRYRVPQLEQVQGKPPSRSAAAPAPVPVRPPSLPAPVSAPPVPLSPLAATSPITCALELAELGAEVDMQDDPELFLGLIHDQDPDGSEAMPPPCTPPPASLSLPPSAPGTPTRVQYVREVAQPVASSHRTRKAAYAGPCPVCEEDMQHTTVAKCTFHGQSRWAHTGCIASDGARFPPSPSPSPPPSPPTALSGQPSQDFRPVSPDPSGTQERPHTPSSRRGSLAPMILELPSAQRRGAAAKRQRDSGSTSATFSVREAQLGERTGSAARQLLTLCLAGTCQGSGSHLRCSSCAVQVHATCAGAVEREVDSSSFRCPQCQCEELSPGTAWEQGSDSLRSLVLVLCLQSVITVRGTTVTQWRQLRTLLHTAETDLGLPCLTSSAARLKAFLCWLLTRGYAASIDTYVRGLSSMLGSPASDWLKSNLLLGVINRAHREHGEDHRSAACFPVNLVLMALKELEPPPDPDPDPGGGGWGERAAHSLLLAAVLAARFVLGLRPGESGESTGAHHLTAPNIVIGSHAKLGEFVEVVLEHCKTAHQRCKITGAGKTASGIRLALHMLRYSMAAGFFRLKTATEGNPGFTFDAYVIRLSLQEHDDQQVQVRALTFIKDLVQPSLGEGFVGND